LASSINHPSANGFLPFCFDSILQTNKINFVRIERKKKEGKKERRLRIGNSRQCEK
jgi:hypothetical protein